MKVVLAMAQRGGASGWCGEISESVVIRVETRLVSGRTADEGTSCDV